VPFAVKVADVATPLALVTAVFAPPANAPLGPLAGAVNVTVTFGTGFPVLSFTVACNAVPNAVLIGALCPEPAVAVIVAGATAVFVRLKLAGPIVPAMAVTA
jgi:hypothetical protein